MEVKIDELIGILDIPPNPKGLVLFSHGSGSSRLSPRNTYVAKMLIEKGLATLLIDLLTPEEDKIYENRFNINLLTERLLKVTSWLTTQMRTEKLPIGLFGSSTGAASALNAAAHAKIRAIVSRGGRPDLANELEKISCPTLLIVGSLDNEVITLNEIAYAKLHCSKKILIIEGATHLFEEPGCLQQVAIAARDWFLQHLG